MEVNLDDIDNRLRQLTASDRATSYNKQKNSLRTELETFLASIPGYPTLATVLQRDICRFLIYKDRHGKTQVHSHGCENLEKRVTYECGFLTRLSYKTIDSYIGKLLAILQAHGRLGEWHQSLGVGNPATNMSLKDYLRLVTAACQQLQARVTPKQATPFFVE